MERERARGGAVHCHDSLEDAGIPTLYYFNVKLNHQDSFMCIEFSLVVVCKATL